MANAEQLFEAMEKGHNVYIIIAVGNPEDDEYTVIPMRVRTISLLKQIASLSYPSSTEIVDRSSFDEIFIYEEDAWEAIRGI